MNRYLHHSLINKTIIIYLFIYLSILQDYNEYFRDLNVSVEELLPKEWFTVHGMHKSATFQF